MFNLYPGWGVDQLAEAMAMPLADVQADAERAILQAIAAHARSSMTTDGEPAPSVGCVVYLSQSLVAVRAAARPVAPDG